MFNLDLSSLAGLASMASELHRMPPMIHGNLNAEEGGRPRAKRRALNMCYEEEDKHTTAITYPQSKAARGGGQGKGPGSRKATDLGLSSVEEQHEPIPPVHETKAETKMNPEVIAQLYNGLRKCKTIRECKDKMFEVQSNVDVSKAALIAILKMRNHTTVSCAHWCDDMWRIYEQYIFNCANCGTYTHHKVCTCQKRGRQNHIKEVPKQVIYPQLDLILKLLVDKSAQKPAAKGAK